MNKVMSIVVVLLCFMASCRGAAKQNLQKEVQAANVVCPFSVGMVGDITSITYDEKSNEVGYEVLVAENIPFNISALNRIKFIVKKIMLESLMDSRSQMLVKMMADADAKLTYTYKSADYNVILKIEITESEVKDVAAGKIEKVTPQEMLQMSALTANVQCPMQIDRFTVMTSVDVEDGNLVYVYEVDERYVSINALRAAKTQLRAVIKNQLLSRSVDPSMSKLLQICKNAEANIVYKYVGEQTGDKMKIVLDPSELQ